MLLVDGDEQGSASLFSQLRADLVGECGYTAVGLHGAALRTQVRQLAGKYGDIIIDVGGRDTGSLRAALTVANVLLVPVQPRSFDVWALDQVAALVVEAREINSNFARWPSSIPLTHKAVTTPRRKTRCVRWPRSRPST